MRERARGLGRKTREETGKRNQTSFNVNPEIPDRGGNQTSPASLQGDKTERTIRTRQEIKNEIK